MHISLHLAVPALPRDDLVREGLPKGPAYLSLPRGQSSRCGGSCASTGSGCRRSWGCPGVCQVDEPRWTDAAWTLAQSSARSLPERPGGLSPLALEERALSDHSFNRKMSPGVKMGSVLFPL